MSANGAEALRMTDDDDKGKREGTVEKVSTGKGGNVTHDNPVRKLISPRFDLGERPLRLQNATTT